MLEIIKKIFRVIIIITILLTTLLFVIGSVQDSITFLNSPHGLTYPNQIHFSDKDGEYNLLQYTYTVDEKEYHNREQVSANYVRYNRHLDERYEIIYLTADPAKSRLLVALYFDLIYSGGFTLFAISLLFLLIFAGGRQKIISSYDNSAISKK